jgi:hypothetical protein
VPFPQEYALVNRIDHPKVVYLREAEVLPHVDDWLSTELGSRRRQAIAETLAEQVSRPVDLGAEAARKKVLECDRKLRQYRAALDAGADPVEVSDWINVTKQDRADVEAESRRAVGPAQVSAQEISDAIEAIGGLVEVIVTAESGDKAGLYRELGLRLTYRPQKRLVEARLEPGLHMCKRSVSEGGLEPPCPVKGTSTSS